MTRAQTILTWPVTHLASIAWVALVGSLTLIANILWSPSVEPLYPAELVMDVSSESPAQAMVQDESMDFIFRPLFLPARKPVEVAIQAEPETTDEEILLPTTVDALKGYALLGVFSSDDVSGAILLKDEKERVRLYVGESLEGWQLQDTGLRAASFSSPQGDRVTLELALASTLPIPEVSGSAKRDLSGRVDGAEERSAKSVSGEPSEAQPENARDNLSQEPIRPTFDSIAAQKKAKLAERRREKSANP